MAGLFIVLLVEKCTACQSHWKSDFGWHRFQKWAYSLALAWGVRGLKSLKRFWPHLMAFRSSISTGKPEQLLSLMCVFFRFPIRSRAQFMRLVYARENDPNYNSIRFEKPNKEYLVMILAVKRKLWAIFLPWVHLEEKQTSGSRLKHK